jgi:Skp family chaperone for outer membrane proteins
MHLVIRLQRIAAAGSVLAVALASAPTLAATASPQAGNFAGPNIPGVCILNRTRVLAASKVGVSTSQQFTKLHDTAQTAVNAAEAKIMADNKQLQQQAKSLPPAQLQQRQQSLVKRQSELQANAAQQSRDMEQVRLGLVSQISVAAQPIIVSVYRSHKCGLLLSQDAVLAGSGGMDLTPEILKTLI